VQNYFAHLHLLVLLHVATSFPAGQHDFFFSNFTTMILFNIVNFSNMSGLNSKALVQE
jgi:hypothetical protein